MDDCLPRSGATTNSAAMLAAKAPKLNIQIIEVENGFTIRAMGHKGNYIQEDFVAVKRDELIKILSELTQTEILGSTMGKTSEPVNTSDDGIFGTKVLKEIQGYAVVMKPDGNDSEYDNKPFVPAKYDGAFAIFPSENEAMDATKGWCDNLIRPCTLLIHSAKLVTNRRRHV